MSAAASNYLESKLLDHVLNHGSAPYTGVSTVYVGLFASGGNNSALNTALESGTNSTSGTGNWGYYEINNGSYARQSVTFAAASSGASASNSTVTFPVATANYNTAGTQGQTVTHIAIVDAATSGNVLFYGALTTSKTVSSLK